MPSRFRSYCYVILYPDMARAEIFSTSISRYGKCISSFDISELSNPDGPWYRAFLFLEESYNCVHSKRESLIECFRGNSPFLLSRAPILPRLFSIEKWSNEEGEREDDGGTEEEIEEGRFIEVEGGGAELRSPSPWDSTFTLHHSTFTS